MDKALAKLSNRDIDFRSKSWGPLPNEPEDLYDVFLQYCFLGPTRTIREGYRKWLIKEGRLLPGQPVPEVPSKYNSASREWSWRYRARDWDEQNWEREFSQMEDTQTALIHDMIARHLEGWQVLQSASIQSFFLRDEDNNVVRDSDNNPIVVPIEDIGIASRTWRQSVTGERVARGLPSELLAMTNEQIQRRIVEIHAQLEQADSDTIDAEFKELEDEDG